MINFYTFTGIILLILLAFTMFFSELDRVLIITFAILLNTCLLYLAENQEMLRVLIERSN